MLFGIDGDNKKCPLVKRIPNRRDGDISYNKIEINYSKREEILKDLENLGISQISLMPEIDNVSEELKKKYSA